MKISDPLTVVREKKKRYINLQCSPRWLKHHHHHLGHQFILHNRLTTSDIFTMKSISILAILLAPTTVFGLLDVKFKAKGRRYFGAIADPNTLSNTNVQTLLKSEFGAITPENSLKWDATEGECLPPII